MSGFADEIRVLHVDDDRSFAELAAEHVERERDGFEVEVVTNPEEALDRLADGRFDCVVSDHEMPEKDGIAFLESVREARPDLPFVLFTGKGSEEIASEAISAGVTDYLQKEPGTSQYEVLANRVENAVEQRRSRQAAEETERRLRTIAEHTNEVLWKFTADWDELLFVNSSYEDVWGRSVEELRERPRSFLDGIHPDDRERVRDAMADLSAGNSVDLEYRVNAAADFGRWVWVQGEPVYGPDGESVEQVVGFARDITDRKERELEHERARRRYAALFEHTHDATAWVTFEDGTPIIREVNPAFRDLFGEPGADLAGRDIDEVVADGDRYEEAREITRQVMEGETMSGEITRDAADGPRKFLWHAVPFEDPETGDVEAGFAVYTDITERHRAEERLESLLAHASDVVAVVDEDGTIQYESPAVERVLGYEPSELVGENAFEYVHPDDREHVAAAFAEAVEDPQTVTRRVEYRSKRADGSWVWVESVGVNETDSALDGYVVTTREIGDRKERERQLRRERDRLDEFASVISHDLLNPLNVLQGHLDLLADEHGGEHVDAAVEAAGRIEELVDDLLTLAREGEAVGSLEAVALGPLAEQCWETVETAGATLEVEADRTVRADRSRLRQLLENLFRNAIQHGGEDATITVGTVDGGFYVADDGPGIPEAERESVFETGYTGEGSGTGFGLAIVAGIVEGHGWEISVTESEAGGARFEITDVDPA